MNPTPFRTPNNLDRPSYSNAVNPPTASIRGAEDAQPISTLPQPSADSSVQQGHEIQSTQVNSKLANELNQFNKLATNLRERLVPAYEFEARCRQAFEVANDLFGNAPTWVCFYRELMGGRGMIHILFETDEDFGQFLRSEQYHQIQLMLTALRSRDQPENDPNDPQRMITVRLPKSLHESICEEALRLKISVNRLCISRMLQLLDPQMIPKTKSKPRGRKPRTTTKQAKRAQAAATQDSSPLPQVSPRLP
ncbi:MAG: hypothetical protein KDB22_27255 [Planctomycetales bacterium]|nr:hypothetical protein [Planctomycetales bacterium]